MERIGDKRISIREAAALVGGGMSPQRMRRRLKALHAQNPKAGIITRPGERWFEVSVDALKRALTTDPELHEAELDAVVAKQNQHEDRLAAMRKRIRSLERRLDEHIQQTSLPGILDAQ